MKKFLKALGVGYLLAIIIFNYTNANSKIEDRSMASNIDYSADPKEGVNICSID